MVVGEVVLGNNLFIIAQLLMEVNLLGEVHEHGLENYVQDRKKRENHKNNGESADQRIELILLRLLFIRFLHFILLRQSLFSFFLFFLFYRVDFILNGLVVVKVHVIVNVHFIHVVLLHEMNDVKVILAVKVHFLSDFRSKLEEEIYHALEQFLEVDQQEKEKRYQAQK